MRTHRAALVIVCAGLLTFGIVFALLAVGRLVAAPAPATVVVVATPDAVPTPIQPVPRATDSLAPSLAAGHVAIGVPSAGSEPLLQGVQPGDRLDVLASLPSPDDTRPVTAVVVRGATVVRPASTSDPLLLEVSSADAVVLAHLVLGETHLSFIVWSNAGSPPAQQQPLDEQTARSLLGLPAVTTTSQPMPTPAPVPATPNPIAAATAVPTTYLYTVQPGESMDSIAARLGIDAGALWWVNRGDLAPLAPLVAGSPLRVPLLPGFLYQIQPGDTWDSVAATFALPAATLRLRNGMADDAAMPTVGLVFIPRLT
jgi:LysM repeat protein